MDAKNNVIDQIVFKMSSSLSSEQLSQLKDVLIFELHTYQVAEITTSIQVYDDSNIKLLQNFLVSKSIEGMAQSSLDAYLGQLKLYIDFLDKPLKEVTTSDIRYYLALYKKQRNISNTTLDGIRRKLNAFFKWLSDEEYIIKNPMCRIAPIKNDTFKKPAFSQTDVELLHLACDNNRDLALLEFLQSTGCRVSEAISVKISDIDFQKLELDVIGKGNKKRTVYLTEKAALHLKIYIESRTDSTPYLFINRRGKNQMTRNGVEQLLKRIGAKAGVTNCHPHRFRTTLCCTLLDRGVDVPHVQQILGHSSVNTTMIYYRYNQERTKAAFRFAA